MSGGVKKHDTFIFRHDPLVPIYLYQSMIAFPTYSFHLLPSVHNLCMRKDRSDQMCDLLFIRLGQSDLILEHLKIQRLLVKVVVLRCRASQGNGRSDDVWLVRLDASDDRREGW